MKDILLIAAGITICILICKKKRKKRFQLVLTTIINNFKIKILSMQLDTKQFVTSILRLVDHDTQQPISATFSDIVLTSSDTSIFTVDSDVNVDGQVDVVGVAEGTASLNVKAKATYFDSNLDEEVTTDEETDIDVTITAPPPGALNTDLVVTFTAPQPLP